MPTADNNEREKERRLPSKKPDRLFGAGRNEKHEPSVYQLKNVLSRSFVALLFALNVYSCMGDSTVSPPFGGDKIIPFTVGNQWVYADSVFTQAGNFVGTYAATITNSIDTLGRSWWQVDNVFNPSIASNLFAVKGDSILSLQATESVHGMAPIVSLEYVRPTSDDTIRYEALYDGDAFVAKVASRLTQPYTVAAGVFDNCILFTYNISREHYREIVSPGIGMIALEIQADSISRFSPAWQRRIELVDYRILK